MRSDVRSSVPLCGLDSTHTSYKDMISLASRAEETGFDLLIVASPYMVTKTEDQVVDWVRLLADETNLAIMFYNGLSTSMPVEVSKGSSTVAPGLSMSRSSVW